MLKKLICRLFRRKPTLKPVSRDILLKLEEYYKAEADELSAITPLMLDSESALFQGDSPRFTGEDGLVVSIKPEYLEDNATTTKNNL